MTKKASDDGYREIIAGELEARQKRNPSYSLRAFSRSLGVSAGMLSQILQGKRDISVKAALKIADNLPLSDEQRRLFLDSAVGKQNVAKFDPMWKSHFVAVDSEQFQAVSHWIYFAILALADVKESRWDADWIAARLNVSLKDAQEAMERLEYNGLVLIEGESFKQAPAPMLVSSPIPAPAIQNYHQQNLEKAKESLTRDPVAERDFNSITLAINSDQIPMVKELTARFVDNIYSLLDAQAEKDRVYTLAIQLFPISTRAD